MIHVSFKILIKNIKIQSTEGSPHFDYFRFQRFRGSNSVPGDDSELILGILLQFVHAETFYFFIDIDHLRPSLARFVLLNRVLLEFDSTIVFRWPPFDSDTILPDFFKDHWSLRLARLIYDNLKERKVGKLRINNPFKILIAFHFFLII